MVIIFWTIVVFINSLSVAFGKDTFLQKKIKRRVKWQLYNSSKYESQYIWRPCANYPESVYCLDEFKAESIISTSI